MTRSRANVKGAVLRWARETRGLELPAAAEAIGTSEERLRAWEEDQEQPSVSQLRSLAKKYARPLGVFFLSEPPDEEELARDFRRRGGAAFGPLSPELRLELRLAQERRREAIELATALGIEPSLGPTVRLSTRDDPELAGNSLRESLGVSLDRQTAWRDSRLAFSGWRNAIEAQGVLVFETGGIRGHTVDPEEAAGFSISDRPFPVIVANGRDHANGRIFTLAHELAHIALRMGGMCDLHEEERSDIEADRVEVFCNRAAGALLVPSASLRAVVGRRTPRVDVWSDSELVEIARRFSVSTEVVLRRLVLAGDATPAFYRSWRESRPRIAEQEGGFLRLRDRVLKRNGRLYPRLVLAALKEGRIHAADAVDLLGAGPKHFGDIEARLAAAETAV